MEPASHKENPIPKRANVFLCFFFSCDTFMPRFNQQVSCWSLILLLDSPYQALAWVKKVRFPNPLPSASGLGNLTRVKSAFCRELRRLLAAGQTMPWRLGRQKAHRHRALAPASTVAQALAGLDWYCKSTLTVRTFSIN